MGAKAESSIRRVVKVRDGDGLDYGFDKGHGEKQSY